MLLITLATIYQGRIPTLTHTHHHVESLSLSHLKYVITGELDTYVTNLIHSLTNPTQRTPKRTIHPARSTRNQPPTSTQNMPHHHLQQSPGKDRTLSPAPNLFTNPLPSPQQKTHRKNRDNVKSLPHTPTRPQNMQNPLVLVPTYNPQ